MNLNARLLKLAIKFRYENALLTGWEPVADKLVPRPQLVRWAEVMSRAAKFGRHRSDPAILIARGGLLNQKIGQQRRPVFHSNFRRLFGSDMCHRDPLQPRLARPLGKFTFQFFGDVDGVRALPFDPVAVIGIQLPHQFAKESGYEVKREADSLRGGLCAPELMDYS